MGECFTIMSRAQNRAQAVDPLKKLVKSKNLNNFFKKSDVILRFGGNVIYI